MAFDEKRSTLVPQQFPGFIRETESPFIDFLESYYEFLEQNGNAEYAIKHLLAEQNIDTASSTYAEIAYKEYLKSIPRSGFVNLKTLAKNIKQFYRARGTEKSFKLFFKTLFGEDVLFYYPAEDILIASDGKWIQNRTLRTDQVVGDPFDLIGKEITGQTSRAKAVIEDILKLKIGLFDFYELFLNRESIDGTFLPNENISRDGVTIRTHSILSSITITNDGEDYAVGDSITISGGDGFGAQAIVSAVGENGEVEKIDILDPGISFMSTPTVTFESQTDTATGTAVLGAVANYPGFFLNEDGMISVKKFLQDSFYYQEFSYVLRSIQSLSSYREKVKDVLHPSGYMLFGNVFVQDDINAGTIIDIPENGATATLKNFTTTSATLGLDTTPFNELIITMQQGDEGYKLGPSLLSFDRDKFKYFPTTGVTFDFSPPNETYWDNYANYQLKDFGDIIIGDIIDAPWKRIDVMPEPYFEIISDNDFEELFAAITVTGDLNPSDSDDVTNDGAGRISALADNRAILSDFTASTTERPWITRGDNRENLFLYSEDLSDSSFTVSNATIQTNQIANPSDGATDVSLFEEDATSSVQRSIIYADQVRFVANNSYAFSGWVKNNGRRYLRVLFDADAKANCYATIDTLNENIYASYGLDSAKITVNDDNPGWMFFEAIFTATNTVLGNVEIYQSDSIDMAAYNGDGSSGNYIWGLHLRNTQASSIYVESAGEIQHRGINSREALYFDGAQELQSTSTLDDAIAAAADSLWLVFQPYNIDQTKGVIIADQNDNWSVYVAGGDIIVKGDDGSEKTVTKTGTDGQASILHARHEGGNIIVSLNGGAETSVACGNISSLTAALHVGGRNDTEYFIGKIARVIVADTVITSSDRTIIYNMLAFQYDI